MNKKNLPVIFAFAIPVVMVIGIALSIYIPRMSVNPQYDFMYMVGDDISYYGYTNAYSVGIDGFLVRNKSTINEYEKEYRLKSDERFYIYDVDMGEAEEITFDEAQGYKLDPSTKSLDGYEVECSNEVSGMFLFFVDTRRDCSKRVISKDGGGSDDLDIRGLNYYNFKFLGWLDN